eukprot:SAG11_NODE_1801_length_4241_cov_7.942781_1_plen_63_part_00
MRARRAMAVLPTEMCAKSSAQGLGECGPTEPRLPSWAPFKIRASPAESPPMLAISRGLVALT